MVNGEYRNSNNNTLSSEDELNLAVSQLIFS